LSFPKGKVGERNTEVTTPEAVTKEGGRELTSLRWLGGVDFHPSPGKKRQGNGEKDKTHSVAFFHEKTKRGAAREEEKKGGSSGFCSCY